MGMYAIDSATAITYVGRTPWAVSTTTGLVLAAPSSLDNDLLITIWVGRGTTDATISPEYTTLLETNGSTTLRLGVYYKINDGTTDSTRITGGSNGQMAATFIFRGVDTTTSFDVTSTAFYNGTDFGTPDVLMRQYLPQTVTDSCAILWIVGSSDDNTWSTQGHYARLEIADSIQNAGTPDQSIMVAWNGKTQAGGIRAMSAVESANGFDAHISVVLALRKDPP
jgi:hypothetical protein